MSCLSELALDRLRSGERPADAEQRAHLASCARCNERLVRQQAERAAFVASGLTLRRPRPAARRFWYAPAAFALAAAAAVALFALRPAAVDDGTRVKGGGRLGFYVKRGAKVWRGAEGERVFAGDVLRFTAVARERRHVAVLSLDGARRASIYFPAGASTVAIDAGAEVALPGAIELDDAPGRETLVGLFCDRPVTLEPLRAALERDGAIAPAACEVDRVGIEKARP